MRALWSDRQNCSHNVSQKVRRIRRFWEEQEQEVQGKGLRRQGNDGRMSNSAAPRKPPL